MIAESEIPREVTGHIFFLNYFCLIGMSNTTNTVRIIVQIFIKPKSLNEKTGVIEVWARVSWNLE